MLVIGLTGGIGSGKSTVARILKENGANLILADDIAKEIMQPHMPAYKKIIEHFGTNIMAEDEQIDRKKLAKIVFSDNEQLLYLNKVTHGAVADRISELISEFRKSQQNLVAVEAIVPIKHGFLDLVDTVWVVIASEKTRINRIMKRSGLTYEEAKKRIESQMSDDEYKSIADLVVYNDGTLKELEEKVWGLLKNEESNPS
ncbi:MAG: dephospho-CoA kinase [Clostridiaceae bacterium]|nr:dephospho-CoA kinase [Clostridiaceae bacterium]